MGAGDLKASLSLNATQFETALARADAKASAFAKKVQGDLSKKIATMFGAGFVIASAKSFNQQLFGRAEEIQKAANLYGKTTDEIQLLEAAAREAGLTLSEYMEQAKSKAIDLGKVLRDMRRRGDLEIISKDNLDVLNENRMRFQAGKEAVGSAAVNTAGGYMNVIRHLLKGQLSAGKSLLGGQFGEAGESLLGSLGGAGSSLMEAVSSNFGSVFKALGLSAPGFMQFKKSQTPSGFLPALDKFGQVPSRRAESIRSGSDIGVNELQRIGAFVGSSTGPDKTLKDILRRNDQMTQTLLKIEQNTKLKQPFGEGTLTPGPF